MTTYAYGEVCDSQGIFIRGATRHHLGEVAACPSTAYLAEQPVRIPVDLEHRHDRQVGEVVHLERLDRCLRVVVALDAEGDAASVLAHSRHGAWYWSPYVTYYGDRGQIIDHGVTLSALALVEDPALVGARPVSFVDDLEGHHRRPILLRAAATLAERRGDPTMPLAIAELDPDGHPLRQHPSAGRAMPAIHRPPGAPQYSAGGWVIGVR